MLTRTPYSKGAGSAGPPVVDPSVRAVPSALYTVLPQTSRGTPAARTASRTCTECSGPAWKSKFYGALVLNHRVVLRAIDATPARWRDDAGSLLLDGASTAASSPRNDLVRPKHWLISTQAASCGGTTGRRRSRTSATRCGPCSTRPRRRCPSGTSVFGVVFVFDLWRGVDGATRREARRRRWRRHGAVAPSPRSRPRGDAIDATHPSLFTGPERAPAPRLDIARGRRGQPGRRLRDQHHALDGLDGPDGPDHDAAREVSRMFVLASSRGPWRRGRRESRYGMNTLAYTGGPW